MRPKVRFCLIQVLGILAASHIQQAKAQQTADDYTIVLLDQTTSMRDPSGIIPGKMVWDDAIDAAVNWVDKDGFDHADELEPKVHAYAVWTFATEFSQDLTQIVRSGAFQVWPKQASDCNVSTQFEQTSPAASFCKFTATDRSDFLHLKARINTDVNGVQSLREHERPGFLNDTPLAESICQTIDFFSTLVPQKRVILTLESDGGENHSIGSCQGNHAAAYSINKAVADWGIPVDTWQLKTTRRSFRVELPAGQGVLQSLPAGGGNPARPITIRADVHYKLCFPGAPAPCPPIIASFIVAPPPLPLLSPGVDPVRFFPIPTPPLLPSASTFSPGVAFAPAAPPAGGTITIDAGELEFFHGLGQISPDSVVRDIIAQPGAIYGVDHVVPGDVDNNGCVNRADLSLLNQRGVIFERANPGQQPNVLADLNRDGWVDARDRDILMANLGRGCIDPALVPDPLPTGKLDLQVRNVDNADPCVFGNFRPEFKIINRGTTPYPINGIDIRMAFNNRFEEPIEFVVADNVVVFNPNGAITGRYGHVIPLETTPASPSCVAVAGRGATQTHHAFLVPNDLSAGASIPPNGGYATFIVQYRRAGGTYPFDVGCNDFSKLPADPARAFHSDKFFNLVRPSRTDPPTALTCEFSRNGNDAASGIDPGIVSCGVNACH